MKSYRINSILRRTLAALLATATLGLAGCIDDADLCPPEGEGDGDKGLHLRFDIVTRGGMATHGSQSRDLIEPPTTQVGTVAENYLDIPNLTFLLFDNQMKLLAPFYPTVAPESSPEEQNYIRYEVNAVITDIYFDFRKETDLNRQVPFYILVLANYSNYDPRGLKMARGMSIEDFFGENSMTFATPTASPWWYPHPAADPVASPTAPQFIPMAGLQSFAPTVEQLMSGEEGNPFRLSEVLGKDINMLRAMAKIEVVDHIGILDNAADRPADSPRIDKVELKGFNSRGSLLPVFEQWQKGGVETQYVTAANVPSTAVYNEPYVFGSPDGEHGKSLDFGLDAEATAARKDKCNVFSVYVPEYDVTAITNNKAWIQLTVMNPDGVVVDEGNQEDGGVLYQLRLAEYPLPVNATGAVVEDNVKYISLLRNNIYRYEIISLGTNIVNLMWTVCPMDTPGAVNIPPFN